MENLLSLLESVNSAWLSPTTTASAMDMILAFVCGLGLFHLLLPFLHYNSPSPPRRENTITTKVETKEHSKARKQSRAFRAYRGSRKKHKECKVVHSLLQSMLGRLSQTISFCQLLKTDAFGEVSKQQPAKEHQRPRQPKQKSTATNLSLVASSAPLKEHLLPEDSTLSPALLKRPASIESQHCMRACQPPETLIPGRCHSPPPRTPSPRSPSPYPVSRPPSMPDPSTSLPQCEGKGTMGPSQSTPLPALPSPVPTTPGLEHSSRPLSSPSWYQVAAKTWCDANSSHGESLQDPLSLSLQEALIWTNPSYRQVEVGEHCFIKPDVQEKLELQISKRVELKISNGRLKEGSERALTCVGNTLQTWTSNKTTATSCTFSSRNCRPEQFSGHPQLFYQKVVVKTSQQKCSQLFWGLPFLHSESLVAPVTMVGSPLDCSILFNGFSTYIPIQIHTDLPPQLFAPKPLLQHLVQSQPLTPNLSCSPSPPVAGTQSQDPDSSSLLLLPCYSPPIMDYRAPVPTAARSQFTVPPAVQNLELHFLKKYQESISDLPVIVKQSKEAFREATSNNCVAQDTTAQGAVVHVPGCFVNPELWDKLEQHLQNIFTQHQGRWPHNIQLCLDLKESQHKLPGVGPAEDRPGTSWSSTLEEENSHPPQSVSSDGPKIHEIQKVPRKDLAECLGRPQKDPNRFPEHPPNKVRKAVSEIEMKISQMRQASTFSGSVSPVGPGKKQLAGTPETHLSSKWRHSNDTKVPVCVCHGVPTEHTLDPPENSETNMETCTKASPNGWAHGKNASSGLSILDPGTQKVLETHLKRQLARHRWSLPLRGLKTIKHLKFRKAPVSPFPQARTRSVNFWDARDTSIVKTASVLEEPFQTGPEEEVTTKTDATVPKPPSPRQLEFLGGTPPSDNYGPSEAPTPVQEDHGTSLPTSHSLVGRTWHSGTVLGSWTRNLEPSPCIVTGGCESRESEGMALSDLYHGDSGRKISVASQTPSSRDTRELEEAEEESSDWTLPTEAGEMAHSKCAHKEPLTDVDRVKTIETPSHRTICQYPEDSGLSTPRQSATGVVLQDCATGMFYQDCAPEVLTAADILASRSSRDSMASRASRDSRDSRSSRASRESRVSRASRASQSCSNAVLATSKSTSSDWYPLLSQEENVPKIPKPQEPWTRQIFGPTETKVDHSGPRQGLQCSESKPSQAYRSQTAKQFGDKIKNFISSFTVKVQNSMRTIRAASATTQTQRSAVPKVFLPPQVTEAQDPMTSVGWILEEKFGVHNAHASSKKTWHQELPRATKNPQVCLHRSPPAGSKKAQGNTNCFQQASPMGHSQPSPDKWLYYGTIHAQPMFPASPCQHGAQLLLVPGKPVHCPRHCPYRAVLPGTANTFSNLH